MDSSVLSPQLNLSEDPICMFLPVPIFIGEL